MRVERRDRLLELAMEDMQRQDLRRAKDRLRALLQASPHFQPALELMGRIYYRHGDYRNAVMYWSRAGYWEAAMKQACERMFNITRRALVREDSQTVRYYLYAFAGSSPPKDLAEALSALQAAYFKLDQKRSKLTGLACAPLAGGCLLGMLGLISVLLRAGLGWFIWTGALAVVSTMAVAGIIWWSYLRASRIFRESVSSLQMPAGWRIPPHSSTSSQGL